MEAETHSRLTSKATSSTHASSKARPARANVRSSRSKHTSRRARSRPRNEHRRKAPAPEVAARRRSRLQNHQVAEPKTCAPTPGRTPRIAQMRPSGRSDGLAWPRARRSPQTASEVVAPCDRSGGKVGIRRASVRRAYAGLELRSGHSARHLDWPPRRRDHARRRRALRACPAVHVQRAELPRRALREVGVAAAPGSCAPAATRS